MASGVLIGVLLLFALAVLMGGSHLWLLRRRVSRAWTQVEAQLARRDDLLHRLMEWERRTATGGPLGLEAVESARREAREARGIPARARAENELSAALRGLCRAVPAGEAPRNSAGLPEWAAEIQAAEEQIAAARRAYNQRVMAWNVEIARFPWSPFLRLAGLHPIEYFVLDDPIT